MRPFEALRETAKAPRRASSASSRPPESQYDLSAVAVLAHLRLTCVVCNIAPLLSLFEGEDLWHL
jgi:hypothetical protein